ncbi:MAG: right-handed parallel beta-helix repeat-containing protein [Chloroflexota bacterium]|nr:right-handed parallel beta-helix repeat-containing protein [Chloroflexota bacterium]
MALAAFGLMVSPAWAETYYVDEGSIGGPCDDARTAAQARSAGTPWCSPARALGAAPEGATVVMRAGVYSNIRAVNIARSQMLTFKAAWGEGVTLTGGADLEGRAIYMSGSRNLRFEGFKVTGGAYIRDSSFVELSGNEITTTGLRLRNVADALVEGNEFRDFFGGARALEATGNTGEPGVRRLTIRGNELHRIQHDAIALYWRLENVVVEDNYIHNVQRPAGSDLHPDAIQIAPQSEGAWGSVIVRRNRVIGCDQGLLVKDGTTRGLVVENNVIDNCEFFEAHIYNAPGAKFLNNTIDGRLYFREGATGITALNNIVSTMPVDPAASIALGNFNIVDRSRYNPGYQPGPNDLDGTASFVDVAGNDYRLAAGSIGIDDATSQGIPDHDLRGLARVDDPNTPNAGGGPVAYFDRGAYEHAAQAEPAPEPDPEPEPEPAPLAASFTYAPTSPVAGEEVTFDATASTCADSPCSYVWEDDGTDGSGGTQWSLGTGETMAFTFSGAGDKHVRLVVTDAQGRSDSTVQTVAVAEPT